jgi:hypothetical protein
MKSRRVWVLLVLFLGLAAWLRFVERGRGVDEAPVPYLALEPTRVSGVTVAYGIDTTRMVREGADWWIVAPIRFPADPIAVEALLERLRTFVPPRVFPRDSTSADPYGFADPLNWIELTQPGGATTRLDFGRTAPAAQAFYLQVSGRDSVALVPEGTADNYFRKGLDGWRDPRLFDLVAGRIVAFELERGGRTVRVERPDAASPWRVVRPFPGAAAPGIVDEFVKGLAAMKARSFPAVPPGDTLALGLDRPSGRITLVDLEGRRATLLFGDPIPAPLIPEVAARRTGDPWVFGAPALYLGLAGRSDLEFRDRRPLGADRRGWRSLTFVSGGDSIRLEPDSTGAWYRPGETGGPGAPPPDRTDLVELWAATDVDSILPAAGEAAPPTPGRGVRDSGPDGLHVEVETLSGVRRVLAVAEGPIATPEGEAWPARLLFSDLPRPGEVFHLSPDPVRQALALLSGP